jgi:BCD family chlorophyll transporter-like MFS transporter
MTVIKNIRLGLLHVAVAVSLVPITGVLNRIMITELNILSSIVAALIILPYVLSPMQVWVGQYSDTHPLFGYRRTPYIALGLLLCIGGAALTPYAALELKRDFWPGLLLCALAFGGWGVGFNFAVVSYLSLASDLSEEHQRSRTIAIMWFMMIFSIIVTAILVGHALETYSEPQLLRVFSITALVALGLAALGLIGLEPRNQQLRPQSRHSQRAALALIVSNPQARLFFVYLVLLLAAILGQDILLEPFGAQAFGMSVSETTRLTALWGGMTLIALLLQGLVLSRWLSKKSGAMFGGVISAFGLLLIALSGVSYTVQLTPSLHVAQSIFLIGVAALGFGTGIATSTNLALMLDMTTPEQVGMFIGAWGVADSLARGTGSLLGGVVRDVVVHVTGNASSGYVTVFLIEALMLGVALLLLRRLDVQTFRRQQPTLTELVALTEG